jgi:hypothetical protein
MPSRWLKVSDACLNKKSSPTENQEGILLWHVGWQLIAKARNNAGMVAGTIPASVGEGQPHGAVAAHNSRMLPSGSNRAHEILRADRYWRNSNTQDWPQDFGRGF